MQSLVSFQTLQSNGQAFVSQKPRRDALPESSPPESKANLRPLVTIYTDGAAEPNPGPGGYGIVLLSGQHRKEISGGFRLTTNNRMELLGVIVALEALSKSCRVNLYSDSKYVVDSIQRGSLDRWQKNRWQRSPGQPVKNVDLWKRYLDAAQNHAIHLHWVKGHAGVALNERCDELAVQAAQGYDLQEDTGYLTDPSSSRVERGPANSSGDGSTRRPDKRLERASAHPSGNADATEPKEGGPCRKCSETLIRKNTKSKARKPGQTYYYLWYLFCPGCSTMYMVNEAKRSIS